MGQEWSSPGMAELSAETYGKEPLMKQEIVSLLLFWTLPYLNVM
jgi:hypothetical protein